MSDTPLLDITKHADGSDGNVIANQAYDRIEVLLTRIVEDRTLTTPPGSPTEGQAHIVAVGGSGAWNTYDNLIVYYEGAAWNTITPQPGMRMFVTAEQILVEWDGTAWVPAAVYGEIRTESSGAGSQTIGTSFVKNTQFTSDGQGSRVTLSHANDQLTPTVLGLYEVDYSCSFSGTTGRLIECELRYNGSAFGYCQFRLAGANPVHHFSVTTFLNVATANQNLEVYVKADSASTTFEVEAQHLRMRKVNG